MSKQIVDMYGNVLEVGDIIMITDKANSKESRPPIVFIEIKDFYKGMITIKEHVSSCGSYNWGTHIRPKSSEIRKVSGAFVEAWKSGELFRML
ncbi:hypothetical protein KNT87_gp282 [Erwinia phage Cronus]|uniref:Uncharacterized protein n=1 Tax=Erwinia phage Cronus TaxID=2163633 RepID=A0A2S1GMF8_9CAUD|nr:hypothetical protein KNT87_gp282 [Erwinia phage Cronus]AWD90578.1 hypothetical protein [Erwinia phage Cronus]